MRAIAARYGFLAPGDDPRKLNADVVIGHPAELIAIFSRPARTAHLPGRRQLLSMEGNPNHWCGTWPFCQNAATPSFTRRCCIAIHCF